MAPAAAPGKGDPAARDRTAERLRRASRPILLEELLPSIDRLLLRRRRAPVGAQCGSLGRPRRRCNQAAEGVPLALEQLVQHLLDPLNLFEEDCPPVP